MNIFRFVADFRHLISFFILILKIKNTKNCLGFYFFNKKLPFVIFLRSFLLNPGNLSGCLSLSLYRFIPILGLALQFPDEDLLYCVHCLYNISDEIQKALLSCKKQNFLK